DQLTECGVGLRLVATFRPPEEFGEFVGGERYPGHNPEAPADAAFQRPEEVGMRAGIGDANLPVGRNDLRFEEARRGHAVVLRKRAEPTSGEKPDNANSAAASALDVPAATRCDGIISLEPAGACTDRDGRAGRDLAACRDKGVVQLDRVHVARPNE